MPQTLVFLTDLCGTLPNETPPYLVIWASTERRRAPFGQMVAWRGRDPSTGARRCRYQCRRAEQMSDDLTDQ